MKLPKNSDNAIAANPAAIDVRPPAIILAKYLDLTDQFQGCIRLGPWFLDRISI